VQLAVRDTLEDTDDEDELTESPEVAATVDAVIQLHRLVSEGKVPFHLLDFEALDIPEDPDGDDDDDGADANENAPVQGELVKGDRIEALKAAREALEASSSSGAADASSGEEDDVKAVNKAEVAAQGR